MDSIPYRIQDQDQLCFMHIPKTGGSTLLNILDGHYLEDEICPLRESIQTLPRKELQEFKLIRAHCSYHEFNSRRATRPIFITFLRHPIERTFSVYKYIRRMRDHEQYSLLRGMTLVEYLESDAFARRFIDNIHTRMLSDAPIKQNETNYVEPNLSLAKERLQQDFIFVGLTERFQESLDLLSYTFYWPRTVQYQTVNVTPDPISRSQVSSEIIEKIEQLNRFDLELYNFGVKVFEERYAHMMDDLLANNQGQIHQQHPSTSEPEFYPSKEDEVIAVQERMKELHRLSDAVERGSKDALELLRPR